MSDTALKTRADERLEAALADAAIADPRPLYRERLRALKQADPSAFERALRYFQDTLVPSVADEDSDPVSCWLDYGRVLAGLGDKGEFVEIDDLGRAQPRADAEAAAGRMILLLPEDDRARAFALSMPADPSPAQRATYDLLVRRKLR